MVELTEATKGYLAKMGCSWDEQMNFENSEQMLKTKPDTSNPRLGFVKDQPGCSYVWIDNKWELFSSITGVGGLTINQLDIGNWANKHLDIIKDLLYDRSEYESEDGRATIALKEFPIK